MKEQLDLFEDKRKLQVAITGASGMVGSFLERFFREKGHTVTSVPRSILSDVSKLKEVFAPVDVVINLSGENIGLGRWTKAKKKRIYESRVLSTRNIVEALRSEELSPKVFISTSAIGFYGKDAGVVDGEKAEPGNDFLAKVCVAWEKEAKGYTKGRLIIPRFGVVLSKNGGFLKKMLALGKFCLLGKIADGKQRMSYIAIEDLAGVLLFLIKNKTLQGTFNFTTDTCISNKEFVDIIQKKLKRPHFLPLPKSMAQLIFGEKADALLLSDQCVYPEKLVDLEYPYAYKTLEDYLSIF